MWLELVGFSGRRDVDSLSVKPVTKTKVPDLSGLDMGICLVFALGLSLGILGVSLWMQR